MANEPVIIEAAINGVTTKEQNPNVPRLPDEITAETLRCLAAGAAIVHNHCDRTGVPGQASADRYLEGWRPVLEQRPDALVYPTVNAGPDVSTGYGHLPHLAASGAIKIGLCDPGSVNLGAFAYVNSEADIDAQLKINADNLLGPSMAIFEPGFLRATVDRWRAGSLPPGAMIKLYFCGDAGYLGGRFGLPPTRAAFDAYLEILGDCPLPWSVAAIGGDLAHSEVATLALERGGHLHVGLEDYGGPGRPTNEQLVTEAVELAEKAGRPLATCEEAVAILGLPRAGI